MNNIPNRIYLNIDIGGENPKDIDFNELSGISWCEDRINADDLVYYSKDFIISVLSVSIKETEEELKTVNTSTMSGGQKANRLRGIKKELKYIITQL